MSNEVENIGEAAKKSLDLLKLVYDDLAKPGVSQVGKAIGDILGFCFTPILLFQFGSETAKIIFTQNLDRFREKIGNVELEDITSPPTEVGVDILDHLTKVSDENLAEMFTNLLTKASTTETQPLVHPRFVYILKQISSDEAKILNEIVVSGKFKFVVLHSEFRQDEDPKKTSEKKHWVLDSSDEPLAFPQLIENYCENLLSLGLVEFSDNGSTQIRNRTRISNILEQNAEVFTFPVFGNIAPYFLQMSKNGISTSTLKLGNRIHSISLHAMEEQIIPTAFGSALFKLLERDT